MTAFNTLTNDSGIEQIKVAIGEIAQRYLINKYGFARLIECESSYNPKAIGDGGRAKNLLQYHENTFNENCQGEYDNAKDQLKCSARMIKDGMGHRWTCIYTFLTN